MRHFIKLKKDGKPEQKNCPDRAYLKKELLLFGMVRLLDTESDQNKIQ
jgi:hypothetical protein